MSTDSTRPDIIVHEHPNTLVLTGDPVVLTHLKIHFRHRPEAYWRAASFQLYLTTKGEQGWDGYIYPLKQIRGVWTMPRGRLQDLLRVVDNEKWVADTENLFERPYAHITPENIPDSLLNSEFDLDTHQRTCVAELLKAQIGRVKVTVSGGKTEIFMAIAAILKRRWAYSKILYLTPSERLVNQVYARASQALPGLKVTQMGGGSGKKKRDSSGDLVVATTAVLHRNLRDPEMRELLKTFTAVFADECHYAVSDSWQEVLRACSRAVWRFGASDSMKVNSESGSIDLQGLFGPVLHTVKTSALIDLNRVAVPHIHAIGITEWTALYNKVQYVADPNTIAWQYVESTSKFKKVIYKRQAKVLNDEGEETEESTGLYVVCDVGKADDEKAEVQVAGKWLLMERTVDRAIVRNTERNNCIARIANEFSERGWPTLIVATRTLHCYLLYNVLKRVMGDNSHLLKVLMGDSTSAERDDTFAWVANTPGAVLISPLVKVGVSINALKAGIIADHVVDHEVFNQIVGRFIRKKKDTNVAHVVMFNDVQHRRMKQNSEDLIRWASEADGYELHKHRSVDSCLQLTKNYT